MGGHARSSSSSQRRERCAELISGVLQRIGWVSKHLSGKSQGVRGIVLLDEVHEELGYAAAAVGDTVSFKTWRMSLAFDDVAF